MKKTLAVVLSLLVAFSMFAVSVSAEGETTESTTASVTVKFVYATATEAEVEFAKTVVVGTEIDAEIIPAIEKTFKAEKEDGKTYEYTFKGWLSVDGKLYYDGDMPDAAGNDGDVIVYTAQFSEKEYEEPQSFWNLVESIFERINRIFEYFAAIFSW